MDKTLFEGDYLDLLRTIPDGSVDLFFTDPPYGSTQAKWDTPVDLEEMWEEVLRVCKKNAPLIFFANQPFASVLVTSRLKLFKYDLVWEKSKATGYLNAKRMPMRAHEGILVFCRTPVPYWPEMDPGKAYDKGHAYRPTDVYGEQVATHVKSDGGRYPRSVRYHKTAESEGVVYHPTQKPLGLCRWIIRLYSRPGDLVLDPFAGSGTIPVAAQLEGRRWAAAEKEADYCNHTKKRLSFL